MKKALEILHEMGGLAEVEATESARRIQGYSCPLAGIVQTHPLVCRGLAAFLAEMLGLPVQEECRRGEEPKRSFNLGLSEAAK